MKIGIVSDTHGRLDPRVVEVVSGCDWIVHAGDVGDAGLLKTLADAGGKLAAVRGNNDIPSKWPAGQAAALEALPESVELDLPGGTLAVVHGHRQGAAKVRHRNLRRAFPAARAVVYGHSHRLVIDDETSPWIINPGAAGRARTYGGPSCIMLDAGANQWLLRVHRFPLEKQG